jgi:hypothetical protein
MSKGAWRRPEAVKGAFAANWAAAFGSGDRTAGPDPVRYTNDPGLDGAVRVDEHGVSYVLKFLPFAG